MAVIKYEVSVLGSLISVLRDYALLRWAAEIDNINNDFPGPSTLYRAIYTIYRAY